MIDLQVGNKLILDISAIGYNGEGISKNFAFPIFVAGALTGEKVEAQITKIKKNFAVAKLINVLETSKNRVKALCPYFGVCGGCCYQHLNYECENAEKTKKVADTLHKIAGISPCVEPCVASNLEYGYRNKISVAVRKINGQIKFAYFEEDSKNYVAIDCCPLAENCFFDVLYLIKTYLETCNISVYSELTGKGLVRHAVLRKLGDAFQITLVTNGNNLPKVEILVNLLNGKNIKFSLWQNINCEKSSLITTFNFKHLAGEKFLPINVCGLNLKLSPASFLQVNNFVRDLIYKNVCNLVAGDELVVDAYSGAGVLSVLMAKSCKQVVGIEIVKSAVESANALCEEYEIKNVKNYVGDIAKILPTLKLKNYTLVLDPPRKGVSPDVIKTISENMPNKIIYVSCDEATLARDVKLLNGLTNNAFEVKLVKPYNMFPRTKHIETILQLIKKSTS